MSLPGPQASRRRRTPQERRAAAEAEPGFGWRRRLFDPRSAVLFILAAVIGLGGGRRWLQAIRARRAVARLGESDVTEAEVRNASSLGRESLADLFRLLSTSERPELRRASAQALASLWKGDQLIPEEEKAVLQRCYEVAWKARRRYPREIEIPLPIAVSFGVPTLGGDDDRVGPSQFEWSHRITGAGLASLESWSPWQGGDQTIRFTVLPGDFPSRGPQRVILHARARTVGLTSSWEVDLPQIPFSFEFDPALSPDALLASPDAGRDQEMGRSIRLEAAEETSPALFLPISDDLALASPPSLAIDPALPLDLAHALRLEFEGLGPGVSAGHAIVARQSISPKDRIRSALGPILGGGSSLPDRPGEYRIRAVLSPEAALGWTDPDIRSIWSGSMATDWQAVRVLRR